MKVSELIELLEEQDPDAEVLVMMQQNWPFECSLAGVTTREEMLRLEALLAPTRVLLVSDEVYEHMVYDGAPHVSASTLGSLAARSFVVSSFGKTFHVTGWKIGTVAAPAPLMASASAPHPSAARRLSRTGASSGSASMTAKMMVTQMAPT